MNYPVEKDVEGEWREITTYCRSRQLCGCHDRHGRGAAGRDYLVDTSHASTGGTRP
jgi:hypothetical protein